jgi:hypothetical protein
MNNVQDRYQYFFEKLTHQLHLAEAKLNCLLKYPEYIEILELEEEKDIIDQSLIEMIGDQFKSREEKEIDNLERMILDADVDDD